MLRLTVESIVWRSGLTLKCIISAELGDVHTKRAAFRNGVYKNTVQNASSAMLPYVNNSSHSLPCLRCLLICPLFWNWRWVTLCVKVETLLTWCGVLKMRRSLVRCCKRRKRNGYTLSGIGEGMRMRTQMQESQNQKCHKTMNNTRPKWQNPDIHVHLTFTYAYFSFFVFIILSYQNVRYGPENAEIEPGPILFF